MPTNPLLLPEILLHLAHFVPCWVAFATTDQQSFFDDQYQFTPRDLLSCSSVCRLWYPVFYLQLWTVYDGEIMSPSSSFGRQLPVSSYPIPEEILIAQSPHFRILTRYNGRLSTLHCRHLIDLSLHRTCARSCHLVQMNGATLRRLTWHGNVPYSGMLSDLESYAMSNLTGLECLVLTQWDVSENRLIPTLERNQGTLQKIVLASFQGLDAVPKGLKMQRMRELTLDGEWDENEALVDLIQACPNLERLTLEWTLAEGGGEQLDRLRSQLLQRQPSLKEAERRTGGSIVFVV